MIWCGGISAQQSTTVVAVAFIKNKFRKICKNLNFYCSAFLIYLNIGLILYLEKNNINQKYLKKNNTY